ncbi:MAG: hypothetical protein KGY48_05850 [Wenzhouxiangellaceae bacterium]|nr:hypothetical protein [Wenzhouxiangellaceae bacterium]MBS3746462.1 hypothetical protein [Wenzhouxiangellaceae bacterium]MBS3823037.1 hypothetical protein [Wenzhouxiangellaceae bacterium]
MASLQVHAQQSVAECAEIESDQERLECFDRFYGGAEEGDASASDTPSSADVRPAATDTERAQGEAEQARREAEQARREAAQARREAEQLRRELEQGRREVADRRRENDRSAEPERGTAEDRFGMEKKMLELGGDEMSSTAVGQFDFWNKGQRVELENGQVWEITNSTNLYHKAANPRVTIEKGLFSSFYMHIDGVSKSLKVRRID